MGILFTYLYWINVITFALMAYDRHNRHYDGWRMPRRLFTVLAWIGGVYGYWCARWLFGWDDENKRPGIPWGRKDTPYAPHDGYGDDSTVPGWGGVLDQVPGLPPADDNKPRPGAPTDIVDDPEQGLRVAGNEIIVLMDSDNPQEDMGSFIRQFRQLYPSEGRYKVNYYNVTSRVMRLLVPQAERVAVMDRLEKEVTGVKFLLTDNYALNPDFVPSTPGFGRADVRKYFEAIQAPAAWDITQGQRDVTVAVIDTYFCLDHPDVDKRWRDPINIVTQTRNVLPPAGDSSEDSNHGVHVAGIAIGSNEGRGASGLAPNCSWIPIALTNQMQELNVIEGVMYAIYKGADVINLSLGFKFIEKYGNLPIEEQLKQSSRSGKRLEAVWDYLIRLANERRCVIVWAAGNENALIALDATKRSNETIKVSAVDGDCRKAPFSNFGNYKQYDADYSTVSAPGVSVLSCVGSGQYTQWSGTSMAAPFVSGAVALMKSLDRSLSPQEIISILRETGRSTAPSDHIGPVIQVKDALLKVRRGLAHYDDLLRDQRLLLGQWEATNHLILTSNTDEYLDDILLRFDFRSLTQGELTLYTVNARNTYKAPLMLSFSKKELRIVQTADAHCQRVGVNDVRAYDYECKADANGLLLCLVKEGGKVIFTFNIRKIR